MANLIIIAVILLIVGMAILYIRKEKRRGAKCIGCPAAGSCGRACSRAGCGGHVIDSEKLD